MIIVRLIGGLGNQMFQYAAARQLAHHHNTDLFLDVTRVASYSLREYELDVFKINAKIATPYLLKQVAFSLKDAVRLGIRHFFSGETIIQYIKEQTPDFHEQVVSLPDNICLEGYWQSEKYFSEIVDIIRTEFSFVNPPSAINQELLEEICGYNSVSVHIRRGDYISNPKTMEFHGVLGIDYYTRALNLIRKNVKNPHIFVFSDDISWGRKNLKIDLPIQFIGHNGAEKDYEDLRLMSNCKHHLIANSSFSWWGAWLCENPDKVIYAPKKWFNAPGINAGDLIPDSWFVV